MKIQPAKFLQGKINLPGDKSISHRAALLSAMAEGETRIENFATSADCASTIDCLQNLGVEIRQENSTVFIKGVGKNGFQKPLQSLDCGNSGTTVRLLSGILAGQNFDSLLTGDESLSKRPMKRVIEPLLLMGAKIESTENHLPLRIHGKNPLQAISYTLPVASAQVKSCILLAGLNSNGKMSVVERRDEGRGMRDESEKDEKDLFIPHPSSLIPSKPAGGSDLITRDHTERMLDWFGAEVEAEKTEIGLKISVSGDAKLTAKDLQIPSDISSAAFFIVAAACLENSEIVIENVGLNPTRTAIIEALREFGAKIEILEKREVCNEITGNLRVSGRKNLQPKIRSNVIGGGIIANLIDEIPILAIFATKIEGGLEIRDAGELRVKESDRIAAIVENLRRMNARVEEFPDGFRVEKSGLKGAKIDSFGDHRIAMAFSVAALFAEGETEVTGAESAGVSFPEFFDVLAKVVKS